MPPSPIPTRPSADSSEPTKTAAVMSSIAVMTMALNTQLKPPKNDTDTPAASTKNHRPGRPIPCFSDSEKNSSTESAENRPTTSAKIQSGAKSVSSRSEENTS